MTDWEGKEAKEATFSLKPKLYAIYDNHELKKSFSM